MNINKSIFVIFMIIIVLFSQCAKKEKEKDIIIQPEAVEIEVDVPETQWEKSIAVLPLKSENISLNSGYLADLVSNRLYSDLSKIQNLKVYSPATAELVNQSIFVVRI